jgi:hypothetical protein
MVAAGHHAQCMGGEVRLYILKGVENLLEFDRMGPCIAITNNWNGFHCLTIINGEWVSD